MSDDALNDSLTDLEQKMIDGIEREWQRWTETTGPLPMALVSLMRSAHECILKRVARGMPDPNMVKDPHAALLRVERIRAALIELVQQQERVVQ